MPILYQLLLIVMLSVTPLLADAHEQHGWEELTQITYLQTYEQLPVSAVHTVFRDSEGYIWYGTSNGLCRDDGYHIQVFRNDYLQALPINGTTIWCISEDKTGNLWFGTDDGLYRLDKPSYHIEAIDSLRLGTSRVKGIYRSEEGAMWVHTYNNIYRYNSEGISEHAYPITESHPNNNVTFVELDGRLYLNILGQGLFYYQQLSNTFLPVAETSQLSNINHIALDQEKKGIWLLDKYAGIYHYRPEAEEQPDGLNYYALPDPLAPNDYYQNILQDPVHRFLWIRTDQQLLVYSCPETPEEKPRRIWHSHETAHRNLMLAEMMCQGNEVWSMAFDVQSFIYRLGQFNYHHESLQYMTPRINYNPVIMALADAGEGWLWIFQERVGLCLIHPQTEQLSLWSEQPELRQHDLSSGDLIIPSDVHEGVWVNHYSNNHLHALHREGNRMQCRSDLDLTKYIGTARHCTNLLEDHQGRLWVGTDNGLLVFDARNLKLLYFNTRFGEIKDLAEDEEGKLWVCSRQMGLLCFSQVEEYEECLDRAGLTKLAIDHQTHQLWLGTQQGQLLCYDPRDGKEEDHTQACSLNGDCINRLYCDTLGHLWIGMNQQIIEYNPRNRAIHNYRTSATLQSMSRILPRAFARMRDGQLAFGGIPGILLISPSTQLDDEPHHTHVTITEVWVNGKIQRLPTEQDGSIRLKLNPGDTDIRITFSSLQHSIAAQTRYAYRITELDQEWKLTATGKNEVQYNLFSKGNYTLEIHCMDDNGNWAADVTKLYIEQLPYWYESNLAYLFYCLAAILSVIGAVIWGRRKANKKNEELWADSTEMLKMRQYLQDAKPAMTEAQAQSMPEMEYLELDRLFMEKAERAVREHLSQEDFGVEEFATAVNMSKSTLNRKLKALAHQTPLEYINTYKMRRAAEMLHDPDANVEEVALALGFQSRRYFSAAFKKEYNESPTQYQKRVNQS